MRRDSSMRRCYGITAQYPLVCDGKATVCTRDGKLDLRTTDEKIMRAARRAVPSIPQYVDSGAGPFCPKHAKRACRPMRDLEFDTVSMRRGLTAREKDKLAKAIRQVGAHPRIKKDYCTIEEFDRGTAKPVMIDLTKGRTTRGDAKAIEHDLRRVRRKALQERTLTWQG